jgi:hypothetical protein
MIQIINPTLAPTSTKKQALSLVIVPPILKHFGGPLAGPAYLKGAGERVGHKVDVLDLNQLWIGERINTIHRSGTIKGDHDKPSIELNRIFKEWQGLLADNWSCKLEESDYDRKLVALYATNDEVIKCAQNFSNSDFGQWVLDRFSNLQRPDIVGLSVMFSGQVIAALAITRLVKLRWPGVKVVWGGAHVTALAERISNNSEYGIWVDGFVAGYAEQTWMDLLNSVAKSKPWPSEVFAAGSKNIRAKEDPLTVPVFDITEKTKYDLTLPVQVSRGCAYGKCSFCTYPKIEGKYRKLNVATIESVIDQAEKLGAVVSFKDSLLVPGQLVEVANHINGRVKWSACTKLNVSFDKAKMSDLASKGLSTLEIGLETLDSNTQQLINKEQSAELFNALLDAAEFSGIAVVINYMTGLPGADPHEEQKWYEYVKSEVARRPNLKGRIEHNTFQLELLSEIGRNPKKYNIEILAEWPWSTMLEFRIINSLLTQFQIQN